MFKSRKYTRTKQKGVVLLITLIVLVAMTLAGIALVRSVDTANLIAGNLAFQQAATQSADIAIENAISWLEHTNSSNPTNLENHQPSDGYFANRQDPDYVTGQTWPEYWAIIGSNNIKTVTETSSDQFKGNNLQYVIHRLCASTGGIDASNCSRSTISSSREGQSNTAGNRDVDVTNQIYYRITARIGGPRNTVSYVQAIVAL